MTQQEAIERLSTDPDHENLFFFDSEIRLALFDGDAALGERVANARYHALQFMTPTEFYKQELPKFLGVPNDQSSTA